MLRSGEGVYKHTFRVPISKLVGTEYGTPNRKNPTVIKYAKYLKKGKAKTSPAIRIWPKGSKYWGNGKELHRTKTTKFSITNGHHRVKAHKIVGRKTIKAKIRGGAFSYRSGRMDNFDLMF